MSDCAIRTRALTKRYGKHRGIEGLDLEVRAGEIFGFIGPNGAGKTTTIRTLLNLIFPTSGTAEIFGMDVVARTREIKREIGYVPAEVKYYPGMSVRELLAYSAAFHGAGDGGRTRALVERFDLDTGRRIEDLSTGNAKKVAIVQSLLHSPRLLILDEPTNGLDPLVQNSLYDLLAEENGRGVTVFFSSHVLSEVERLCRRVAVVKEGRVIATEDVEGLRRKQLRKVSFHTAREVGPGDFPSRGASAFRREGDAVRFLYAGDSGALVRELAALQPQDLLIEEPSLEEIFLHYYAKEA